MSPGGQAVLDEADSGVGIVSHLRESASARLLSQHVPKPLRGAFVPATHAIGFGKASVTRQAAKATCVENQADGVVSQWNVSFPAWASVMDLDTGRLTPRTGGPVGGRFHMNLKAAVWLSLLMHNRQVRQVQWHEDRLSCFALHRRGSFSGMLCKDHLSLWRCGVFLHTHLTMDKCLAHPFTIFPISPARTETHTTVKIQLYC